MSFDFMEGSLFYVGFAFVIFRDDIHFVAIMNPIFYILGGILTVGICYVAFYAVRQVVKRRSRRNIDIPNFLVSGDNSVNSRPDDIDPDPPNICRIREKK